MHASTLLFVVLLAYCVTSSRVSALKCYIGGKAVNGYYEQVDCGGTCGEHVAEVSNPITGGLYLLLYGSLASYLLSEQRETRPAVDPELVQLVIGSNRTA